MLREINEIHKELKSYNFLQECILLEFQFLDFGTTILLRFNYIWDDNFNIRDDIDNNSKIIEIKYYLVQELHIHNYLSNAIINNPDLMNWGRNEISLISIFEDNKILEKYDNNYLFSSINYEDKRSIEIIFKTFEIHALWQ